MQLNSTSYIRTIYLLGEGEEGESFGLVKLIKESSNSWQEMCSEEEEEQPTNNFSLDFPPGYVDVTTSVKPKRWRVIKKLLDQRKPAQEKQCEVK